MSMSQPKHPVPRDGDLHSFSQVPAAAIDRSSFDLSHNHKTSFDAGLLIPVASFPIIPGDTFNVTSTILCRLSTPIKPLMDDLTLDLHWWFVPNRLVWSNWVKFMGEQDNPGDSTAYTVPRFKADVGVGQMPVPGSALDFWGLPIYDGALTPGEYYFDTLRLRAWNLTWNTWYRDQNLQASVPVRMGDAGDQFADFISLYPRGKRHDYLTSCLPWPQKGAAVTIPLGTSAPVVYQYPGSPTNGLLKNAVGGPAGVTGFFYSDAGSNMLENIAAGPLAYDPNGTLFADLSAATAATINSLRQAFAFQQVLERDARGGTRYTEIIRSHFGVVSPDARLQRPEFLGGHSSPLQVFSVPQTAVSGATPQGNLAAYGLSTSMNRDFVHSFTEHGFIIGVASVRAPYTYQQRVDRSWSPQTRFDYYLPTLAMLGEQGVLMQELFCSGVPSHDTGTVFGYQERWGEYRTHLGMITSVFRSQIATSLDVWHLGLVFDASTTLNDAFIAENPPVDRVIAVPSEPHFLADFHFDVRAVRPLPVFSVPGLSRL